MRLEDHKFGRRRRDLRCTVVEDCERRWSENVGEGLKLAADLRNAKLLKQLSQSGKTSSRCCHQLRLFHIQLSTVLLRFQIFAGGISTCYILFLSRLHFGTLGTYHKTAISRAARHTQTNSSVYYSSTSRWSRHFKTSDSRTAQDDPLVSMLLVHRQHPFVTGYFYHNDQVAG